MRGLIGHEKSVIVKNSEHFPVSGCLWQTQRDD